MLLSPLRRKRDDLAAQAKRTSDIPRHIIEECCNGNTDEHLADEGFVMDEKCREYRVPDCWREFIKSCDAVKRAEMNEYAATR